MPDKVLDTTPKVRRKKTLRQKAAAKTKPKPAEPRYLDERRRDDAGCGVDWLPRDKSRNWLRGR